MQRIRFTQASDWTGILSRLPRHTLLMRAFSGNPAGEETRTNSKCQGHSVTMSEGDGMSEKTQSDKDTQQSESPRLTPFTALSTFPSSDWRSEFLLKCKQTFNVHEKYICSVQKPFLWVNVFNDMPGLGLDLTNVCTHAAALQFYTWAKLGLNLSNNNFDTSGSRWREC